MGWATSFAFILRALMLFGIMVSGAVVLGALLMANKDVNNKFEGKCDCSLTVRGVEHFVYECGTTGPCNYVVFTAAAYLAFGAVFCVFALVNTCRGTTEMSKFMLIETLLGGIGFLVVFACGIVVSVEFQQLCNSASPMYGGTNCNKALNSFIDAYWDRLTAVEGSLWAMTVMLALLFILGLPRSLAVWRGAGAKPATEGTETGAYSQFDNSSGPV
eukprot:m.225560 g.225560  ORF g.225560 m.225560 type:complete len:216 (-) comp16729_c0_seq1:296-943(-)